MVIINGKKFEGNNISINNGNIVIDGNSIEIADQFEEKTLIIEGDINSIRTVSGSVEVRGNVLGNVETMSGSVICETVCGEISTMSGNIIKR